MVPGGASDVGIWPDLVRLGTVAGVVWTAAWFLFRQQNSLRDLVYAKFDEVKNVVLDKLEYHERHDDQRFDNVRKDLQLVQISLAKTGRNDSKAGS